MSLRLRLILLTVALVTVVVVVLSGLYLNSLVDSLSATALDRAQLASQQVNAYLNDRINRNSPDSQSKDTSSKDKPAPASFDETKVLWREIVASDPEVAAMLFRTMALSAALAEINVAGQDGVILASSNPSRVGLEQARLENFVDWRNRSLYR